MCFCLVPCWLWCCFPGAAGAGTAEPAQGLPLPGCRGEEGRGGGTRAHLLLIKKEVKAAGCCSELRKSPYQEAVSKLVLFKVIYVSFKGGKWMEA